MNWTLRLPRRPARHADREPARDAKERAEQAIVDAKVGRARARHVVGSLERRVLVDNHISEGIARLWIGRP